MTRIKVFFSITHEQLTQDINEWIASIEAEGHGVKSIELCASRTGWGVLVVYGQGPTNVQRWSGRVG